MVVGLPGAGKSSWTRGEAARLAAAGTRYLVADLDPGVLSLSGPAQVALLRPAPSRHGLALRPVEGRFVDGITIQIVHERLFAALELLSARALAEQAAVLLMDMPGLVHGKVANHLRKQVVEFFGVQRVVAIGPGPNGSWAALFPGLPVETGIGVREGQDLEARPVRRARQMQAMLRLRAGWRPVEVPQRRLRIELPAYEGRRFGDGWYLSALLGEESGLVGVALAWLRLRAELDEPMRLIGVPEELRSACSIRIGTVRVATNGALEEPLDAQEREEINRHYAV